MFSDNGGPSDTDHLLRERKQWAEERARLRAERDSLAGQVASLRAERDLMIECGSMFRDLSEQYQARAEAAESMVERVRKDTELLDRLEASIKRGGGIVLHHGEHGGGEYCGIAFDTEYCPDTLREALDNCLSRDILRAVGGEGES
jgi:hypothetical protein